MKYLVLLFFSFSVFAQISTTPSYPTQDAADPLPGTALPENSPIEETVKKAEPVSTDEQTSKKDEEEKENQNQTKKSADIREEKHNTIMVGYQLLTTWIPSKKTVSYTRNVSRKWSFELEYAWSTIDSPIIGVDLGEISEKRYSLMAKRFVGNSFTFDIGPYFTRFKAQVGSDILEDVVANSTSSFSTNTYGIMGGIGNRWQWENGFSFGVDWFRMYLPLFVTDVESKILGDITREQDDEKIRDVLRKFNRIPTFVLLGLNIGYSF